MPGSDPGGGEGERLQSFAELSPWMVPFSLDCGADAENPIRQRALWGSTSPLEGGDPLPPGLALHPPAGPTGALFIDTMCGNDSLNGGAGQDLIDGGVGADTLAGGPMRTRSNSRANTTALARTLGSPTLRMCRRQ